jgi:hypothetical protein
VEALFAPGIYHHLWHSRVVFPFGRVPPQRTTVAICGGCVFPRQLSLRVDTLVGVQAVSLISGVTAKSQTTPSTLQAACKGYREGGCIVCLTPQTGTTYDRLSGKMDAQWQGFMRSCCLFITDLQVSFKFASFWASKAIHY